MKLSDIQPNVHYASIQTADDSENAHNDTIPCCVLGELFQYGFYAEARYRIVTTPDANYGAVAGPWSAFWQSGQGLSPFTNRAGTSIEIDHPEQHGELMFVYDHSGIVGPILDWGAIDWYDGSAGACFGSTLAPGGSRCGQTPQLEDPRQYHTFGVRVTTDGSTGIAYCSYVDGVQSLCASATANNAAQYAEKKYFILFMGIACYGGGLDTTCTNIPITSWYSCGSPVGSQICLSTNGTEIPHTNSSWASSISGVSGCSSCNGSWFLLPFTNGTGGTDYFILQGADDATDATPPWPGGTPTGGTVNALSQVDMYIDHVRVWTCSAWQSGPCKTSLGTGSP
jgi:hypothetical protein